METYKINSVRKYYKDSLETLKDRRGGYSDIWCREASELILELLDELDTMEYEYAVHWTHIYSGTSGRLSGWGEEGWGVLEEAELELADQKSRDKEEGVADQFRYKLLRRRVQGGIEEMERI